MSTKFSGQSKVQKPPAVCRAPPQIDGLPLPTFDRRQLLCYAEWNDPGSSEAVATTGYFDLNPTSTPNTWQGDSPGPGHYLRLKMTWTPGNNLFRFTLYLMLAGTPADERRTPPLPPQTMQPFDSGLVNYNVSPYNGAIHSRVMS